MFINPTATCPPLAADPTSARGGRIRPTPAAIGRLLAGTTRTMSRVIARSARRSTAAITSAVADGQNQATISNNTLGSIERHRRSR